MDNASRISNAPPLKVAVHWPDAADDQPQEFFLGGWHPERPIEFTASMAETDPPHKVIAGLNYFLASSTAPFGPPGRGIVWKRSDPVGIEALGFRGYVVSPPLSALSEPVELFKYWSSGIDNTPDGVFATALIGTTGASLSLVSDPFGISPLYYRLDHGAVFFSTNARFLAAADDRPHMRAWRAMLHSGFTPCDWSLTEGIERVPPGHILHASSAGVQVRRWFDLASLADAPQAITAASVEEAQRRLVVAVDRCLAASSGEITLPLSSGHDSRRILAALLKRGVRFEAATVQVFQKGDKDLDAPSAIAMARRFGFPHIVLEHPSPEEFALDDRVRCRLTDCETKRHTWAVPLWRRLADRPRTVFDGLAGDVWSETGFEVPSFFTDSEEQKAVGIARRVIGGGLDRVLRRSRWPSVEDLVADVADYVRGIPEGMNRAEFAFLLLRSRRQVSTWAQYLSGPGHVLVYPYLEREHVAFLVTLNPLQKIYASLQAKCLREFEPELYAFSGSRQIPPDAPVQIGRNARDADASLRLLEREMRELREQTRFAELTTPVARVIRSAARLNRDVAWTHTARWLAPLLSLLIRESRPPALVIKD